MTKKFISRQTGLPIQTAKIPFSPRPFAPAVQAKVQSDTTAAPSVEHLSQNSNLLSRLTHSEPVPESQQIGLEVGNEGPNNQHKIQRKHHASLAQVSALPPTPPSASHFPIQAKLTVGAAGDKYEQEADQVARQVVNRIQAPQVNLNISVSNPVQRKISIQAFGGEGGDVSSEWESQLNQARGGGQPLSPSVKEPMEREFGADFSAVRVHTGAQADSLARSIQAKAFTTGQDVFFRQGAYEPGSRSGQELIAHELTHVKQQVATVRASRVSPTNSLHFQIQRQLDKFEGKSSGMFKGRRDRINEQIEKYNTTAIATLNSKDEPDRATQHESAQEGMQALYDIQQKVTVWLEEVKAQKKDKRAKINEIETWYQQKFWPEYDRVTSILSRTADLAPDAPPRRLPPKTEELLTKYNVTREAGRDLYSKGDMATGTHRWDVIVSESYTTTEPTIVYRVGYASDKGTTMRSYDPRSARPLKPKKKGSPGVSELMSYGHVYFALDRKVIEPYIDMLDDPKPKDEKVKAIGKYELPRGFKFKRDPEIPGGFRATQKLPNPIEVNPI